MPTSQLLQQVAKFTVPNPSSVQTRPLLQSQITHKQAYSPPAGRRSPSIHLAYHKIGGLPSKNKQRKTEKIQSLFRSKLSFNFHKLFLQRFDIVDCLFHGDRF